MDQEMRRDPVPDPLSAKYPGHCHGNLRREADPVVCAALVCISPPVRTIPQELIEQVTVLSVDLDDVENRGFRIYSTFTVLADDAGDLISIEARGIGISSLHLMGYGSFPRQEEQTGQPEVLRQGNPGVTYAPHAGAGGRFSPRRYGPPLLPSSTLHLLR
jgi:hypothetical protein